MLFKAIYGSILHVVDDASHMLMMERPDTVNEIIHDFIGGDCSSAQVRDADVADDVPAEFCFDERRPSSSRTQRKARSKSAKSIPSRFVASGF